MKTWTHFLLKELNIRRPHRPDRTCLILSAIITIRQTPYPTTSAGKYIRELFAKENRCNDCRQVGHGYKTCTNRRQGSFTRSNPRSVDNHEVLIQELTSQLDDNLKLTASIDLDETSYALFHPPLVIQASAAADGHTSIATSPTALRFLLDTGASRSFCCSVRVRVM